MHIPGMLYGNCLMQFKFYNVVQRWILPGIYLRHHAGNSLSWGQYIKVRWSLCLKIQKYHGRAVHIAVCGAWWLGSSIMTHMLPWSKTILEFDCILLAKLRCFMIYWKTSLWFLSHTGPPVRYISVTICESPRISGLEREK